MKPEEVGIYKRKQESKKTRKQEKKERKQEIDQENGCEKKEVFFFFLGRECVLFFFC